MRSSVFEYTPEQNAVRLFLREVIPDQVSFLSRTIRYGRALLFAITTRQE